MEIPYLQPLEKIGDVTRNSVRDIFKMKGEGCILEQCFGYNLCAWSHYSKSLMKLLVYPCLWGSGKYEVEILKPMALPILCIKTVLYKQETLG